MSLTNDLKRSGYDLIQSPVRNHKLLQLWNKKAFDEISYYYEQVSEAFNSPIQLDVVQNAALSVNATQKEEYSFNIGVTVLQALLQALGLGTLQIDTHIKSGKKITISYDHSITKEVPLGKIDEYFAAADFKHRNPQLLKNANRNNLHIINGVLYASSLVVEIDTDFNITADLVAELNNIAGVKAGFQKSAEQKLKITSEGNERYPIAVKAYKLAFVVGKYKRAILVTDTKNLF